MLETLTREQLEALPRRDLQKLCKESTVQQWKTIRANAKVKRY